MTNHTVFLGGSCNPTTWRTEIAIPLLEEADVSYYNPQVEDWYPELISEEADAKANSSVLLFVIDSQTRAIASILEAVELIVLSDGRSIYLVVNDITDQTIIDNQLITERELKDLNRARDYLRNLAVRYGIPIHKDIAHVVQTIISEVSR